MPENKMDEKEFSEGRVAQFWDENADLWSEQVRKGWDGYREHFNNPAFFEFIGDLSGKTILDAGCGEGYNTRILAKKAAHVVGVDISKKLIGLAQQQEQKEPLGIQYIVGSFADLSFFSDSSFDTALSFMALMDGPHYEQAIKEIFRILHPSGSLIFSITHPCFITKGIGWVKDENGNPVKLTVSDYFAEYPWLEQWRFSDASIPENSEPFKVPRFLRTLSEYINTLIDNGFVLEKLQEPRPPQKICTNQPWLKPWRNHASLFLYIHAVKPD